ncbi:hypothetical protein FOCC_FOCC016548 [Frankliniella occidentalis]|nr:hypothetical protein FOCC_FOCC016548 [Frankliniella occidentalis]
MKISLFYGKQMSDYTANNIEMICCQLSDSGSWRCGRQRTHLVAHQLDGSLRTKIMLYLTISNWNDVMLMADDLRRGMAKGMAHNIVCKAPHYKVE